MPKNVTAIIYNVDYCMCSVHRVFSTDHLGFHDYNCRYIQLSTVWVFGEVCTYSH